MFVYLCILFVCFSMSINSTTTHSMGTDVSHHFEIELQNGSHACDSSRCFDCYYYFCRCHAGGGGVAAVASHHSWPWSLLLSL